jgi:ribosome-associated protein
VKSLRLSSGQDKIQIHTQDDYHLTNPDIADALSFDQLKELVINALEDFKAIDIQTIDVSERNPLTELFVIASGSSSRHVKSMAENLVMRAKAAGCPPLGVEGQRQADWVLVDLNDVIVHLMLPQARAFYNLEKLWQASSNQRSSVSQSA